MFGFKIAALLAVFVLLSCGISKSVSTSTSDPDLKNYREAVAIYDRLTVPEKIGQLVLPNYQFLADSATSQQQCADDFANHLSKAATIHDCGIDFIAQYHIGAVLSDDGSWLNSPTAADWRQLNQWMFAQHALGNPKDPLLLTRQDVVRFNMSVQGGVISPHQIGLGATHNLYLIQQIGKLAAQDSLAIGFNWIYQSDLSGRQFDAFHAQYPQGKGFTVGEWRNVIYGRQSEEAPPLTLTHAMAKTINAGIDMIMIGGGDSTELSSTSIPLKLSHIGQVYDAIKDAVDSKLISEDRLKDAVVRILATKLVIKSHTFEHSDYAEIQAKERKIALQAAQQSLVLLKNNLSILPVTDVAHIKNVVFVGDTNDMEIQNGGRPGRWEMNWQGQKKVQDTYFQGDDRITSGSNTIQESVQTLLGRNVNYYAANETRNTLPQSGLTGSNTLIIAVVAEQPNAESTTLELLFGATEQKVITALRNQGIKAITIVYSSRPMIIGEPNEDNNQSFPLNNSDVVIAAFLPGSLGGQAIANAIFGHYLFGSVITAYGQSNTLTFPWPANMEQVANHFSNGSLYPVGYGLSTKLTKNRNK